MIKHKVDSIKAAIEQAANEEKDKQDAHDTVELLKGCIMELADVVFAAPPAPDTKEGGAQQ